MSLASICPNVPYFLTVATSATHNTFLIVAPHTVFENIDIIKISHTCVRNISTDDSFQFFCEYRTTMNVYAHSTRKAKRESAR